MRILRAGLILLITVAAQAAPPAEFHIVGIDVKGVGPQLQSIVVAQSLLAIGSTYSESELSNAVSRIRRLPFVRDVDFSLAKGSERGQHRLIIEVEPMMSLFFDTSVIGEKSDNRSDLNGNRFDGIFGNASLLVGGRLPVGTTGIVRASISSNAFFTTLDDDLAYQDPTVTVGYSLYRVGSRAIFADASVAWQQGSRFTGPTITTNLILGIPLRGSDSLRGEWLRSQHSQRGFPSPEADTDITFDAAQLFWLRDTTDDPLYPLNGSLLKGGFIGVPVTTISPENIDTSMSTGVEIAATRYWEIGRDRSVALRGHYIRSHIDGSTPPFLTVGTGLTQRLASETRDAWLALNLEAERFQEQSFNSLKARIELAHRSRWGVARVGFTFVGQRN